MASDEALWTVPQAGRLRRLSRRRAGWWDRPPRGTGSGCRAHIAAKAGKEKFILEALPSISFVGSLDTVRAGLDAFRASMQPDELIVLSQVYDHAARLRCYELLADLA